MSAAPLHIWLVQTGEPLALGPEERKHRTGLLAEKLAQRGHRVIWWASAFNHLQKTWYFSDDTVVDTADGITVRALRGTGYRSNVSLRRVLDHRLLSWKFRRAASRLAPPDLIVASMPPHDLASQAVRYGRRRGIPVIVDIRDQWPDVFVDAAPRGLKLLARSLLWREFTLLRELLRGAVALVSMTDSLLEWGLQRAGRPATRLDRVFHLGYGRERADSTASTKISPLAEALKGKFVVSFIGTFATYHNPETLIDCARRIGGSDVVFVLAGDGELRGRLHRKAKGLDNVIFAGWLDQSDVTALLRMSHLGVCPSPPGKSKLFFPNKAFVYWSAGVPVASAFEGEIATVIDRERAGFTYRTVDDLAEGILELRHQPQIQSEMSANARKLFDRSYDADRIYEAYADHVETVFRASNPSAHRAAAATQG